MLRVHHFAKQWKKSIILKKMQKIIESKNEEDSFEVNCKSDNQKMNEKYRLNYKKKIAKAKEN